MVFLKTVLLGATHLVGCLSCAIVDGHTCAHQQRGVVVTIRKRKIMSPVHCGGHVVILLRFIAIALLSMPKWPGSYDRAHAQRDSHTSGLVYLSYFQP